MTWGMSNVDPMHSGRVMNYDDAAWSVVEEDLNAERRTAHENGRHGRMNVRYPWKRCGVFALVLVCWRVHCPPPVRFVIVRRGWCCSSCISLFSPSAAIVIRPTAHKLRDRCKLHCTRPDGRALSQLFWSSSVAVHCIARDRWPR